MNHSLARIPSWLASHWRMTVIVGCAVGLVATCKWCLETDEVRAQRATKKRELEVRRLVRRISTYAHNLRKRYPTGEAVVSEADLALQFHEPPELVVTALDILLGEQRAQKAPLSGYWKLLA